jgi:hypothetical protein
MMRNSEIVKLVDNVNNVLHRGFAADGELKMVQRWAQMGVEEDGSTPYRIAAILAQQLQDTLDSLAQTVVANQGEAQSEEADQEIAFGSPTRTIVPVDEVQDDTHDDESNEYSYGSEFGQYAEPAH